MAKKIIILNTNNNCSNVDLAVDVVRCVTNDIVFVDYVVTPTTSLTSIIDVLKSSDGVVVGDLRNTSTHLVYEIKKALNLYANVKRYKSVDGAIDLVIVKEQLSGLYHGEHGIRHGILGREAYDTKIYSAIEIERTLRVGFELAAKRNARLVLADMPNTETGRLFRSVAAELVEEYPEVSYQAIPVTQCITDIVTAPQQYDVIVTSNLYGDILGAAVDGITKAKGLTANLNVTRSAYAMCEEVIDPVYTKELQNPLSTLLSIAMLFRYHYDNISAASKIENAVKTTLSVTKPIDMAAETENFSGVKDIIDQIKKAL